MLHFILHPKYATEFMLALWINTANTQFHNSHILGFEFHRIWFKSILLHMEFVPWDERLTFQKAIKKLLNV